jgi:hypothetical protein
VALYTLRIKAEVCVFKQKVSGVAIQNQVKGINWKNKGEEWTHHIMCGYITCVFKNMHFGFYPYV